MAKKQSNKKGAPALTPGLARRLLRRRDLAPAARRFLELCAKLEGGNDERE